MIETWTHTTCKHHTAPETLCPWCEVEGWDAQVVTQYEDYGQGYDESRVFVRIGDRLFHIGATGYGHPDSDASLTMAFAQTIVQRWNENDSLRQALETATRRGVVEQMGEAP